MQIFKYLFNWYNALKFTNVIKLIPEKYIYVFVITLWVILWVLNFITEQRLIRFSIIIIIIAIYKILHKQINKVNVKDKYFSLLLIMYKYKNPLILLILEIELKMSYFIYFLSKINIKLIYIKIIYNLTGLNAIKIILTKFYIILLDWKTYTIYEIIFKRIYGVILSVLIFTNIIQLLLLVLKTISTSYVLWIYIFALVISYVIEPSSIRNIEYLRKESNFLWLILVKKKEKIINIKKQDIKILLGIPFIKDMLTYDNYFKYLLLSCTEYTKINYYKPSYMYFSEIKNIFFSTDYIFNKNEKLKKNTKNKNDIDLINLCEYNILIYKLVMFYTWDIEKELKIKEQLTTIKKEYIDLVDRNFFTYEYNEKMFKQIYFERIQNVKLNKFWDLIENRSFYEKMHFYLYDYNFLNTSNYIKLLELQREYNVYDIYIEVTDYLVKYEKQQSVWLIKQLEDWKEEWILEQNIQEKYYNIFKDIDCIKNKINENSSS